MALLRPLSRLPDITTGHGCWAPSVGVTASPNVYCNKIPVHVVGDTFTPHTCGTDVHSDVASVGSLKVFINKRSVMRLGDLLAPPALMAQASFNVFAGSKPAE